jgi:hypothetical protein
MPTWEHNVLKKGLKRNKRRPYFHHVIASMQQACICTPACPLYAAESSLEESQMRANVPAREGFPTAAAGAAAAAPLPAAAAHPAAANAYASVIVPAAAAGAAAGAAATALQRTTPGTALLMSSTPSNLTMRDLSTDWSCGCLQHPDGSSPSELYGACVWSCGAEDEEIHQPEL